MGAATDKNTTKPLYQKSAWLDILKQASIPSFGDNIRNIVSVDSYNQQHAAELARNILKDPNLTTSVLKMANSPQFNTQGSPIRTVSRAIMVLGHKVIKEISASCLVLDAFQKPTNSKPMQAVLARSFHSALQARQIAILHGEKATEEIFISALLMRLGEIALYAAIDEQNAQYRQLCAAYPFQQGKEKDYIGCYFSELTLGLCDSWQIAPMVADIINGQYDENSPLRSVLLGASFAEACEVDGTEGAIKKHLKSIARYTRKDPELIAQKLKETVVDSRLSLESVGLSLSTENQSPARQAKVKQVKPKTQGIDRLLLLDNIEQLSSMPSERLEFNQVINQILDVMVNVCHFQTALIAVLNPQRSRLIARQQITRGKDQTYSHFNFSCGSELPEVYQKVVAKGEFCLNSDFKPKGLTEANILRKTRAKNAVWGPLIADDQTIGCFYADTKDKISITPAQLQAFKLMVNQARLLLHNVKAGTN